MYIERLRTDLHVHACSSQIYLLSEEVSRDCENDLFQKVMAF